jgi:hypothetical protein
MTIQRRFAPIRGRFEPESLAGLTGIYKQREVVMGVLHNGKEKSENLIRKTRIQRSEQKKSTRRKSEKNKLILQLTIPSRRGRRKK